MPFGRYHTLMRQPGVPRLVASVLIGRLPIGIFSLAIVLLVRQHTHSFAQAGAASAAWALGAGVVAPLQGRLVDRFGQPAVLVPSTLLNAGAVAAVVVGARHGAPIWLLALFAWLGGAALPPLGACMRSIWASTFVEDASARNVAYTFESMVAELFYIVGPAITTLLIAISSPGTALLLAIGLSAAGTLAFATAALSRGWRGEEPTERSRAGALAAPGMRTLMLAIVPTGVAFGGLEVAMPAFAVAHGRAAGLAGILLTAMAVGSLLGGFWYGARNWSGSVVRRFIGLQTLFTLGLLPLLIADSVWTMAVVMTIAGLALAPSAAAGYLLVDRVAPAGTATEATTWVMTANVAGAALGAVLGGVVAQDVGVRAALVLVCVGPLLGTLVTLARRRTLQAPSHAHVAP
ncbi:MAG TPA: MFS transporter [Conexibacter sp.]|nr:MFS transporter [Conexibacter sp.]